MELEMDAIARLALDEFLKLAPNAASPEVEEIEKSGDNLAVTIGYWSRDSKPLSSPPPPTPGVISDDSMRQRNEQRKTVEETAMQRLLNPWRRKYKQVVIDAASGNVVSIKMYGPPLEVL